MRLAWVAVLGVACLARAESLSLSVASGTRCVTESSLRQQLTRAGLVVAQSGELDVDVSSSPDGAVRLRARRGRDARLLVRTLPVRSTCDGLELALVTLIREWATASALVTLDAGSLPSSAGFDARLTRSDPAVTRSDPALTRSDPATTRSDSATTRSDSATTRSDSATTRSDSAATRSDAGVTRSDSATTRSDAGVTRSDSATTRSDAGVTRSDSATTRSDSATTRGDAGVTRSDSVTTRSDLRGRGDEVSLKDSDPRLLRLDARAGGSDAALATEGAAARSEAGVSAGTAALAPGALSASPGAPAPTSGQGPVATKTADSVGDAGAALSSESPWEVRFAFAGGVTALPDAPVSPSGSAILDVGRGPLGTSLEGAFDANVTLSAEGGTLTFNTQSLTLNVRWRFAWERLSVDLGVGVRGFRISATPAGFTTNTPAILLSLGPAANATVWVRLAGPLQLVLRGSAALRFPADQLNILNGPSFRLGPVQVGAVAGLALAWP